MTSLSAIRPDSNLKPTNHDPIDEYNFPKRLVIVLSLTASTIIACESAAILIGLAMKSRLDPGYEMPYVYVIAFGLAISIQYASSLWELRWMEVESRTPIAVLV